MSEAKKTVDSAWRCTNCKALLGFVDESGMQVRLKYKDFYATVEGGRVSAICRKCGKINVISDELYEKFLAEYAKKQKEK